LKDSKRNKKEANIIVAAEDVFSSVGFKNAKMEDIAEAAGITKVTLYTYFQSKENLYLAITYKAITLLNDKFYNTLDEYKSKSGIESAIALLDAFMTFCENNYLYSEALLDYFALVRSTSANKNSSKLTDATKESLYYMKLQDIQNLAFKLSAKEIIRGQEDGSIIKSLDPMRSTLQAWTSIIGYIKVLSASGDNKSPLFNISLGDLKENTLKVAHVLLSHEETVNQIEKL